MALARSIYRIIRKSLQYALKQIVTRGGILIRGADLSGQHGVELRTTTPYVPIAVRMPDYRVDDESQAHQLKDYLENPNLRAYAGGILSAPNVAVHYPSMVHRWNSKTFIEGYLDDSENFAKPKLVLDFIRLQSAALHREDAAVLFALPLYSNYYHWMVEMLPRLAAVDEAGLGKLPLLVPARAPAFVHESLELSGAADRIRRVRDGNVRYSKLYIPTLASPPSHPSPHSIEWLASNLPNSMSGASVRKLYVSRRDAPTRFATNELEVEALLSDHGFETVTMSGMTLQQQIDTFASASAIVGLHGAALTNLAFCSKDAKLIEIFMGGWFTNAFYHTALIRGMKYGYLVCPPDGAGLRVDIARLRSLLAQMDA